MSIKLVLLHLRAFIAKSVLNTAAVAAAGHAAAAAGKGGSMGAAAALGDAAKALRS